MALLARATGSIFFLTSNSYSKFIFNCLKVKIDTKKFIKTLILNSYSCNVRCTHTDSYNVERKQNKYVTYDEVLAQRRLEARRSVLIEVQSEKSCTDVYVHCSQFGKINGLFHYNNTTQGMERHFVLIEFDSRESVDAILSASTHVNHEQIIPVRSTMLWFRNVANRADKKPIDNTVSIPLSRYSCKILSNDELFKILVTAKSISDQIKLLYGYSKLNDVGARLRFYTAYQIECCFHGLFPNIAVLPFGSSVNGFGKQGCDLDLSLVFEEDKTEKDTSRLVFQTKSMLTHERHQMKRVMDTIANLMIIFVPGIHNVKKILEARVPIIKFDHSLTRIECDLSMTNLTAYYMSELLYMYGEMDWRVRPLIFTVRKWAQSIKLTTKNIPGPWITNFSLSLMVLFFLQEKKILPALNLLKSCATREDIRIADIYVDCTFQRDITKIPKNYKISNTESLEVLLLEFFTYFGNFDFETKALSLRDGKPISKPEYSALYICNPLETNLNVSKNVRFEELERIRVAMRSASWQLECADNSHRLQNWGLLKLFTNTNFENLMRSNSTKSINIEDLFEDDSAKTSTKRTNEKKKQKKNKSKLS